MASVLQGSERTTPYLRAEFQATREYRSTAARTGGTRRRSLSGASIPRQERDGDEGGYGGGDEAPRFRKIETKSPVSGPISQAVRERGVWFVTGVDPKTISPAFWRTSEMPSVRISCA